MNEKELELTLLEYWKAQDVERVYKFKDCIYEYQSGDEYPVPIFADLGERLFVDIPTQYELAPNITYGKTSPVIDLISARGGERVAYLLKRKRQESDPAEWPHYVYMTKDAVYLPASGRYTALYSQFKSQALRFDTEQEARDMLKGSYATEIETVFGKDAYEKGVPR